MGFQNIFACLVHESRECVVDLVRNLRYLDPSSTILLYNGGKDPDLLTKGFPFERYGAVIHPAPHPLDWGRLHDFALDSARFAFDRLPFDTMTIVDSDQLATRRGYSRALARFLSDRPRVGMIASDAGPQPTDSRVEPVVTAFAEFDLWRTFLRRFPEGESKYVHWTFWPGTVFTRALMKDLVRLFDDDTLLRETLAQSRIWATEEILLPTLAAVLGHEVVASPFRRDFVRFRMSYNGKQIEDALNDENVFWIHPVPRRYGDPRRRLIRGRLDHYERPFASDGQAEAVRDTRPAVKRINPTAREAILATMEGVEGWLSSAEADLLIETVERAIAARENPPTLVEVGSYCGRSTVVLGGVVRAVGTVATIMAIDPHDGVIGALDQGLVTAPPTLERLRANIERAGLSDVVTIIEARASDVNWNQRLCFLLIDGLHDYVNVALDFFRFEPWLSEGGYVAFHDYADYFPGVRAFVNELLATEAFERVGLAGSLVVLRRATKTETGEEDFTRGDRANPRGGSSDE